MTDDSPNNQPVEEVPKGFINIGKAAYTRPPISFWIIQGICLFIILFILDKNTGGGIISRIITIAFCIAVGGFLGAIFSYRRNGNPVSWFRYGSGIMLVMVTLILWAGNGKYDQYGNYKSPYSNAYKYPRQCKADCGHPITSSRYDNNGYHFTCTPGRDGESIYDKARKL